MIRYKISIAEAFVEVERLNELRGQKLNRVKIVEREKSALEGRKKEADVYLRDKNELTHNQSALCQVHIHQATANSILYEGEVAAAEAELLQERNDQAGTRVRVEELQVDYDDRVTLMKVCFSLSSL